MKAFFSIVGIVLAFLAVPAYAQFPQAVKAKERMQQSSQRPDERKPPAYKPKTNTDVMMAVTSKDVPTFDLARAAAVTKAADGQPLWLYIRFKDELGKYVYRTRDESGDRYLLALEIGKPGIMGTAMHYVLSFTEPDLKKKEIKISLTGGLWGRNRSLPIFLRSVADPDKKIDQSELSLTNTFGFPRSAQDDLARIPLVADRSKGNALYEKMLAEYNDHLIRETAADVLPREGSFDDAGIKARLDAALEESGVSPERIYFAADNWVEFSDQPMRVFDRRTITAVFTYSRDGQCYYGTVLITQPYDAMRQTFGASTFEIARDLPRPCELK